jgi:hypothetical protein
MNRQGHGAGGPRPSLNFSVSESGDVGQVIRDQDGRAIAWTTDGWVARVICKLLNENEGLLGRRYQEDPRL